MSNMGVTAAAVAWMALLGVAMRQAGPFEPSAMSRANSLPAVCVGCWGSASLFDNSECIDVTWQPLPGCADGVCQGEYPNCNGSPCELSGKMTVKNNCPTTIYVREKIGTECVAGTVQIAPNGSYTKSYDGDALDCNSSFMVRVYVTDPGTGCPTAAAAGGTWVCTECYQPH